MELIEKLECFRQRGFTYIPSTGKIYGSLGNVISAKDKKNYIKCSIVVNNKRVLLKAHQLAWYLYYNKCPILLDHINRIKDDNRIENLREVTNQENMFNNNCSGYSWRKNRNMWVSTIKVDNKSIYLGSFCTEEEAHQAYLNAKKIYHRIE